MIGPMDDGLIAAIREDPSSADARELLGELMAGLLDDIPRLTSTDLARVRGLARLLDDVAQHQPPAERAAAKASAATADRVADFLAELGRAAREGFGDPGAW